MPRVFPENVTHTKSAFFAHPQRSTTLVWFTSMLSLLVPTCLKLRHLSDAKNSASNQLNVAQTTQNKAQQSFNECKENLREANQRIIDLNCAMAGYQSYNNRLISFQENMPTINTTAIDQLRLIWNMEFVANRTDNEQITTEKSWDEDGTETTAQYSCGPSCGGDENSCCTTWVTESVTYTYYYKEITNIHNDYLNILNGEGLRLPSLDCGYYAREFEVFAPRNYISYESPHAEGGSRESGTTYISFSRNYGSLIQAFYKLDGIITNFEIKVPQNAIQNAAETVTEMLSQFFIAAIATFNLTGANYPTQQISIQESLPSLEDTLFAANMTLQQTTVALSRQQSFFKEASNEYKEGLSLWLSLFFCIPGGLALLTYIIIKCRSCFEESSKPEVDVELANAHVFSPR